MDEIKAIDEIVDASAKDWEKCNELLRLRQLSMEAICESFNLPFDKMYKFSIYEAQCWNEAKKEIIESLDGRVPLDTAPEILKKSIRESEENNG